MSDSDVPSVATSGAVALAVLLAWVQGVGLCFGALFGFAYGVKHNLGGLESWVPMLVSLAGAAAPFLFLARINAARIFLAGQHLLIALLMVFVAILAIAESVGIAAVLVAIPLVISAAAAFSYVSPSVRRWCTRT